MGIVKGFVSGLNTVFIGWYQLIDDVLKSCLSGRYKGSGRDLQTLKHTQTP